MSGAVHDEWAFLALLLNCRSHSAVANLMVLDAIGKAVRQRLKMVLCIDLPVLSARYSKSGAFAACTGITTLWRPRECTDHRTRGSMPAEKATTAKKKEATMHAARDKVTSLRNVIMKHCGSTQQ